MRKEMHTRSCLVAIWVQKLIQWFKFFNGGKFFFFFWWGQWRDFKIGLHGKMENKGEAKQGDVYGTLVFLGFDLLGWWLGSFLIHALKWKKFFFLYTFFPSLDAKEDHSWKRWFTSVATQLRRHILSLSKKKKKLIKNKKIKNPKKTHEYNSVTPKDENVLNLLSRLKTSFSLLLFSFSFSPYPRGLGASCLILQSLYLHSLYSLSDRI